MPELSKLQLAFKAIDAVNQGDPNSETWEDVSYPKEYLYSLRMSEVQEALYPEASELLKIACRAQHIARWKSPRSNYPMDKKGYIRWRTELGQKHSQMTQEVMGGVGYSETDKQAVHLILTKQKLKQNRDTQALEDVSCLVFLKYYFRDFAAKHSEEKLIPIIHKTWFKMSDIAHKAALKLSWTQSELTLIQKSLDKEI